MSTPTDSIEPFSDLQNLSNFDLVQLGTLLQKKTQLTREINDYRQSIERAEKELALVTESAQKITLRGQTS